jgi:DNA end-binding protein Ku
MASIWKGSLTFGLVHVPVEMNTAVRSDHISFRMLHAEDMSPIKYERVCQADGEPVPWSEIVKGYEYEKGKFVVLTDDDFKKAALDSSRTIDIIDFVREDEIDPRYFESPYFLVPREGGDKAYALLRDALAETGKVGIGTFAMRNKQHLAAVKPMGEALVLELMRFEAELVDPEEMRFPDSENLKVRPQERAMAVQLIENLAEPFDPSKYRDEYEDKLHEIIKAKAKGKKLAIADAREPEQTKVVDLVSRLQESLEASAGGKRPRASAKPAAHKRASKSTRRKTA